MLNSWHNFLNHSLFYSFWDLCNVVAIHSRKGAFVSLHKLFVDCASWLSLFNAANFLLFLSAAICEKKLSWTAFNTELAFYCRLHFASIKQLVKYREFNNTIWLVTSISTLITPISTSISLFYSSSLVAKMFVYTPSQGRQKGEVLSKYYYRAKNSDSSRKKIGLNLFLSSYAASFPFIDR